MIQNSWVTVLILFVISSVLTGYYRQYALSRHILDIPNSRSAHQQPIPRGAGIVFVGLFFIALVGFFPQQLSVLIWTFGIAVLGYCDDKRPIPAVYRIIVHCIFSLGALIALKGMPDVFLGGCLIEFGFWTSVVGVIYLVWMLNLYNFMDGINGLAGFEALSVILGMAVLYALMHQLDLMYLPLLLAAGVAGFLLWNVPFAKVFMGDVGSGFLGFILGVWSLQSAHMKPQLLWSWLILLGVFIVDATVTLLKRMWRKESLHIAHSSHAYQHAARRYGAHWPVTLMVVALNVVWLWPIAIWVGLGDLSGIWGLCMAYAPLIFLTWYFEPNVS